MMELRHIDRDIFENEVVTSVRPVLLCCYKNTVFHGDAVSSIEELSRQFDTIQFYAAQEEELDYFFERLHFLGTPLFLFMVNGREQGRLLGAVSTDRLRAFIESNMKRGIDVTFVP